MVTEDIFFCDLVKNDESVVFFPNSGRFFKTNKNGEKLIKHIAAGGEYDTLPNCISITPSEYVAYCKTIESYNCHQEVIKNENLSHNLKILDRLVIHVANDCNLRCIYCYAAGGAYGSHRGVASIEIIEKALDKFFGYFDVIRNIQIFGGEPLYNMGAINFICEYVHNISESRGIQIAIGIVTNGTLIDDEFIKLVKQYNINVTISYDGSREINNFTRPYVNGRGSSADILNKMIKLYEETCQPSTIEVTYTQHHINQQVSIIEILKKIHEILPSVMVHLVPVSGKETDEYTVQDLSIFGESVNQLFDENINPNKLSYSLMQRIIVGIANHTKGNNHICSAGVGTLSVSIKGDVYPCFMFTDEDDLKLGNIKDDNLFESYTFQTKLAKLQEFSNKSLNVECSSCFMRKLCNGCLGLNANHKGDDFEINHKICEMYRDMAKQVIIQCVKHNVMSEVNNNEKDINEGANI